MSLKQRLHKLEKKYGANNNARPPILLICVPEKGAMLALLGERVILERFQNETEKAFIGRATLQ